MNPVKLIQAALVLLVLFVFVKQFTAETPVYTENQPSSHGRYINIYGETVELADYFGKYLWVDYAAEWCSYCDPQTQTLKTLASQYAGQVDFLTIVTGTDKVMRAPEVEHIRAWADRHNLDPRLVIGRFYTDRLPYHLLYAPDGSVLYRHSGLLSQQQVSTTIQHHLKNR